MVLIENGESGASTVDTNMHGVVAAELSVSNVTDGEVLPKLFKQPRCKINEV
ncbi:hypothetical protein BTN50_0076 [Candidatus Enterovibrio altilux]|uniref:Mobile element protein n=1 Tax=Candidatus Enterovibrio altilux TaxID=1927128 RepID=A0A291B6J4_9GAMM|nr:hypothetical protein BTN50_0076 [Candidatus Enterovibrio luxaltus]